MTIRLNAGDSFENLTLLVSWNGSVELTNATALIYTGSFADYNAANPFNGAVSSLVVVEGADLSSISGTYDVTATDTVAGVYDVHAQVTLESGEIKTKGNVERVVVEVVD